MEDLFSLPVCEELHEQTNVKTYVAVNKTAGGLVYFYTTTDRKEAASHKVLRRIFR